MNNTILVHESQPRVIELTVEQADVLRKLGVELKGNVAFYRDVDVNTSGEEVEGDSSREDRSESAVITCTHLRDNQYRVKVANAVGAVALPGASLHIEPKIHISHFAHLAKRAVARHRSSSERVSVDSLDTFWELVATWCVSSVEKIYRAGLLSDYREESDDLSVVRGRVNVRRTAEMFVRGQLAANCTFDEFDIDNSLNRVLRRAMGFISSASWLQDVELKKRAARMDRAMEGVGPLQHGDLAVKTDRRSRHYSEALDLSLRVLGPVGANVFAGAGVGRTFLIPTPGLMEEGLRAVLADGLSQVSVKAGKKVVSQSPFFSVNPDLVFNNGVITGDVKYKIASPMWVRSDVSQAALFATSFQASAALITTFSNMSGIADLEMQLGDLLVKRIVWCADEELDPLEVEIDFIDRVRLFVSRYVGLVAVA
jgi:5-methylcytosine-specific restriction endonuclease McrBC regulatory subunit McrC